MRKRQGILGALLVISLLWCAIPVFAGWSWCGSDPIFEITLQDGQVVTVEADIELLFGGSGAPDYGNVDVKLVVPESSSVNVIYEPDKEFAVKVNGGNHGQGDVKLQVKVAGEWRDDYLLQSVDVTVDGAPVAPRKAGDSLWMFDFELP